MTEQEQTILDFTALIRNGIEILGIPNVETFVAKIEYNTVAQLYSYQAYNYQLFSQLPGFKVVAPLSCLEELAKNFMRTTAHLERGKERFISRHRGLWLWIADEFGDLYPREALIKNAARIMYSITLLDGQSLMQYLFGRKLKSLERTHTQFIHKLERPYRDDAIYCTSDQFNRVNSYLMEKLRIPYVTLDSNTIGLYTSKPLLGLYIMFRENLIVEDCFRPFFTYDDDITMNVFNPKVLYGISALADYQQEITEALELCKLSNPEYLVSIIPEVVG